MKSITSKKKKILLSITDEIEEEITKQALTSSVLAIMNARNQKGIIISQLSRFFFSNNEISHRRSVHSL